MDRWETPSSQEREAMVKRIKDNTWAGRLTVETVTGDRGLSLDLATGERGWTDTEGLTDTSMKIGHTIAQFGTRADHGSYGKGIDSSSTLGGFATRSPWHTPCDQASSI